MFNNGVMDKVVCVQQDDRVQKMLATQTAIAVLRFIDNHGESPETFILIFPTIAKFCAY